MYSILSWLLLKKLKGKLISSFESICIIFKQIPNEFFSYFETMQSEIHSHRTDSWKAASKIKFYANAESWLTISSLCLHSF